MIRSIGEAALGGFQPDLTLILDMDPETGSNVPGPAPLSRTDTKGNCSTIIDGVRKGFLAIAADAPERCVVIDAAPDEDRVAETVLAEVERRFEEAVGWKG